MAPIGIQSECLTHHMRTGIHTRVLHCGWWFTQSQPNVSHFVGLVNGTAHPLIVTVART